MTGHYTQIQSSCGYLYKTLKNLASQHSSMEWERVYEYPTLNEDPWTVHGFMDKESQSFLKVHLLIDQQCGWTLGNKYMGTTNYIQTVINLKITRGYVVRGREVGWKRKENTIKMHYLKF